jgi:hypothetical protein
VTNKPVTETKEDKVKEQFIQISVEIAADVPKFGRLEMETWFRDSKSRENIGLRKLQS